MKTLLSSVLAVALVGCGTGDLVMDNGEVYSEVTGELMPYNGRPYNGRPVNGRFANGRFANGRFANGRPVNGFVLGFDVNRTGTGGLTDPDFDAWFAESGDYAGADREMKYVVKCAAPAGTKVNYTATNGVNYLWAGELGVAPQWFNKTRTTVDATTLATEQRRVTACLLGLTNSIGQSVQISATGLGIALTSGETSTFPNKEGRFFGNIFLTTPKVYACAIMQNAFCDGAGVSCPVTQGRTCAADPVGCAMTGRGTCASACSGTNCTGSDGIAYPWMETAVKSFNGDGVCNPGECGYSDCYGHSSCSGTYMY